MEDFDFEEPYAELKRLQVRLELDHLTFQRTMAIRGMQTARRSSRFDFVAGCVYTGVTLIYLYLVLVTEMSSWYWVAATIWAVLTVLMFWASHRQSRAAMTFAEAVDKVDAAIEIRTKELAQLG